MYPATCDSNLPQAEAPLQAFELAGAACTSDSPALTSDSPALLTPRSPKPTHQWPQTNDAPLRRDAPSVIRKQKAGFFTQELLRYFPTYTPQGPHPSLPDPLGASLGKTRSCGPPQGSSLQSFPEVCSQAGDSPQLWTRAKSPVLSSSRTFAISQQLKPLGPGKAISPITPAADPVTPQRGAPLAS